MVPQWGKNNIEGASGKCLRAAGGRASVPGVLKLYPPDGIPACITFCSWLSGGDMVNAERSGSGALVGREPLSSERAAGSALQWLYWILFRAKTRTRSRRAMTILPLQGKGFSRYGRPP